MVVSRSFVPRSNVSNRPPVPPVKDRIKCGLVETAAEYDGWSSDAVRRKRKILDVRTDVECAVAVRSTDVVYCCLALTDGRSTSLHLVGVWTRWTVDTRLAACEHSFCHCNPLRRRRRRRVASAAAAAAARTLH